MKQLTNALIAVGTILLVAALAMLIYLRSGVWHDFDTMEVVAWGLCCVIFPIGCYVAMRMDKAQLPGFLSVILLALPALSLICGIGIHQIGLGLMGSGAINLEYVDWLGSYYTSFVYLIIIACLVYALFYLMKLKSSTGQ